MQQDRSLMALLGIALTLSLAHARPLGPEPEIEFEGKIGFATTADTLLECSGTACSNGGGLGGLGGAGPNCQGLDGSTVLMDDVPETDTLTIVHARLNWVATVPSMGLSDDEVTLTPPGGEPVAVAADPMLSEAFEDSADAFTCQVLQAACGADTVCAMRHYSNHADITDALQAHRANGLSLNGDWSLSDITIPGSNGDNPQTAAAAYASNTIGAWSLIIVYRDPANLPTRRLYFYRGLELFSGMDVTLQPSGFTAPPDPSVDIALMVLEGDEGIMGDGVTINGVRLFDNCNPAQNLFNSTVNTGTMDGACRAGVTGVDLDRFEVPNAIQAGDERAEVRLNFGAGDGLFTPKEQLFTNWMIVSFDHLLPNFDSVKPEKESDPASGTTVLRGDTIRYVIKIDNRGDAPATNVVLRDSIPRGTTYVAGSSKLDNRPFADDNGGRCPLEAGLKLTDVGIIGDSIDVGESHVFEFSVTVNDDAPHGFEISNIAYIAADLVDEIRTEPVVHPVAVLDGGMPEPSTDAGVAEPDADVNVTPDSATLTPVMGGEAVAGGQGATNEPDASVLGTAPNKADQCGEGTQLGEDGKCVASSSGDSSGCLCDAGETSRVNGVLWLLTLLGLGRARRRRI